MLVDLYTLLQYHLDNYCWVVYMDTISWLYGWVDMLFYMSYYQFTNVFAQGVVEIPAYRRSHRKPVHIKIIVIGPAGSGKTSFMLRYTKDDFDIFKHPSVSLYCLDRKYKCLCCGG